MYWLNHKNLKRLINNESGYSAVMIWVTAVALEFMIVYIYLMVTPYVNMIGDIFIEQGAPLTQSQFTQRSYAWAFAILGVGVLVWAILASYRREDDTGIYQERNY